MDDTPMKRGAARKAGPLEADKPTTPQLSKDAARPGTARAACAASTTCISFTREQGARPHIAPGRCRAVAGTLLNQRRRYMVDPGGIEPPSEELSSAACTSVSRVISSAPLRLTGRPFGFAPVLISHLQDGGPPLRECSLCVLSARSLPRDILGGAASPVGPVVATAS